MCADLFGVDLSIASCHAQRVDTVVSDVRFAHLTLLEILKL